LTKSHSAIQYTLFNVIRLMNYVEHKKHYSQVAFSEKSVTITQIQCVHYYKFARRSGDGSPTLLSSTESLKKTIQAYTTKNNIIGPVTVFSLDL